MNGPDRVQHLRWLLERQLAWIASADTKAAGLIAVYVALAAVAATLLDGAPLAVQEKWLFAIAGTAAVPGVIAAIVVFMPQIDAPHTSTVYFGGIGAFANAAEYHKAVAVMSEDELVLDLVQQVHVNALIASRKHASVRLSAIFGALTLLLWLVAIAVTAAYPAQAAS